MCLLRARLNARFPVWVVRCYDPLDGGKPIIKAAGGIMNVSKQISWAGNIRSGILHKGAGISPRHSPGRDGRRMSRSQSAEMEMFATHGEVHEGSILCPDFSSSMFRALFPNVVMAAMREGEMCFVLSSGCLESLVQFMMFHSHSALFRNNRDMRALYLSYYRLGSTEEVLAAIKEAWKRHFNYLPPMPYRLFPPSSR